MIFSHSNKARKFLTQLLSAVKIEQWGEIKEQSEEALEELSITAQINSSFYFQHLQMFQILTPSPSSFNTNIDTKTQTLPDMCTEIENATYHSCQQIQCQNMRKSVFFALELFVYHATKIIA